MVVLVVLMACVVVMECEIEYVAMMECESEYVCGGETLFAARCRFFGAAPVDCMWESE